MSAHKPTAINPWTYAAQFYSGDNATSSDYNQIVNNLSLLYAKPYLITSMNTALGSTATNTQLFTSNFTNVSNSPASFAGSITNTSGTFTIPTGLSGLYRVTMRLSAISQSTAGSFNMLCTTAGGASGNNATFASPRIAFNANGGSDSMGSFVWTFSGNGTTSQFPTSMTFTTVSSATSTGYNGFASPNYGTTSTYVQIEYLGTSNGNI